MRSVSSAMLAVEKPAKPTAAATIAAVLNFNNDLINSSRLIVIEITVNTEVACGKGFI